MLHTLLSLAVLITSQAAAFVQGQTPTTTRPPAPPQFTATYRVGPSDVLGIKVFGEEELSNKYTVDTDGSITFPLIGRFHVGAKTTREIEEGLTKGPGARLAQARAGLGRDRAVPQPLDLRHG
jgi:polysaccharide export outer membrane protein